MPKVDVADERRAQITQAALTCFARKGYHRTTMDDIVAESGLSKGTLYWYFASKRALFLSVMKEYLGQMAAALHPVLESTQPASEKLHQVAESLAVSMEEAQPFINVMVDFWAQTRHEEDVNQLLLETYAFYSKVLSSIIEEGVRQGEFRPVNPADLASLLIGVVDGLMIQQLHLGITDWQGVTQTLLDVLLKGLWPREGEGRWACTKPGR